MVQEPVPRENCQGLVVAEIEMFSRLLFFAADCWREYRRPVNTSAGALDEPLESFLVPCVAMFTASILKAAAEADVGVDTPRPSGRRPLSLGALQKYFSESDFFFWGLPADYRHNKICRRMVEMIPSITAFFNRFDIQP